MYRITVEDSDGVKGCLPLRPLTNDEARVAVEALEALSEEMILFLGFEISGDHGPLEEAQPENEA